MNFFRAYYNQKNHDEINDPCEYINGENVKQPTDNIRSSKARRFCSSLYSPVIGERQAERSACKDQRFESHLAYRQRFFEEIPLFFSPTWSQTKEKIATSCIKLVYGIRLVLNSYLVYNIIQKNSAHRCEDINGYA